MIDKKSTADQFVGFHGTGPQFDAFHDRMTFFARDRVMAEGYAHRAGPGGKVLVALLTISRPKVLEFLAPNTPGWYARKRQLWIGQGYDGLIIGGNVYVVFWAGQISDVQPASADCGRANLERSN